MPENYLFKTINDSGLGRLEKVLAVIRCFDGCAKTAVIEESLMANGVRRVRAWNVSQILRRSNGMAVLTALGWRLTPKGEEHVRRQLPAADTNVSKAATSLREHAAALPAGALKDFVVEAVRCVEERLWRAAVLLAWVGAIWHLQNLILENRLETFNEALQIRFAKYKPVKSIEGFSSIGEADFLQVCHDIDFIDKSAKKLLAQRLDLRNAAGHPNSIRLDEEQVAAHVTFLINNVYARV